MLTVNLLFQIGYVSLEELVFLGIHVSGCTARASGNRKFSKNNIQL